MLMMKNQKFIDYLLLSRTDCMVGGVRGFTTGGTYTGGLAFGFATGLAFGRGAGGGVASSSTGYSK